MITKKQFLVSLLFSFIASSSFVPLSDRGKARLWSAGTFAGTIGAGEFLFNKNLTHEESIGLWKILNNGTEHIHGGDLAAILIELLAAGWGAREVYSFITRSVNRAEIIAQGIEAKREDVIKESLRVLNLYKKHRFFNGELSSHALIGITQDKDTPFVTAVNLLTMMWQEVQTYIDLVSDLDDQSELVWDLSNEFIRVQAQIEKTIEKLRNDRAYNDQYKLSKQIEKDAKEYERKREKNQKIGLLALHVEKQAQETVTINRNLKASVEASNNVKHTLENVVTPLDRISTQMQATGRELNQVATALKAQMSQLPQEVKKSLQSTEDRLVKEIRGLKKESARPAHPVSSNNPTPSAPPAESNSHSQSGGMYPDLNQYNIYRNQ